MGRSAVYFHGQVHTPCGWLCPGVFDPIPSRCRPRGDTYSRGFGTKSCRRRSSTPRRSARRRGRGGDRWVGAVRRLAPSDRRHALRFQCQFPTWRRRPRQKNLLMEWLADMVTLFPFVRKTLIAPVPRPETSVVSFLRFLPYPVGPRCWRTCTSAISDERWLRTDPPDAGGTSSVLDDHRLLRGRSGWPDDEDEPDESAVRRAHR